MLPCTHSSSTPCPLFSFDEYLDLRPYLAHTVSTAPSEDGSQASSIPDDAFDYTLFGVVTHIGTMQQGHYIAFIKQARVITLDCQTFVHPLGLS